MLFAIIAIVLIVVAAPVIILQYYTIGPRSDGSTTNPCNNVNSSAPAPGIANATSTSPSATVTFTIIESDPGNNYEGMNGSAYHLSVQWPIITVHQGQRVVIHIYNCASSESHGFAITNYFNAGVTVRPGQSYTLTFVANQKGSFRMFCSIFCSIHPLMQNGAFVVTQ